MRVPDSPRSSTMGPPRAPAASCLAVAIWLAAATAAAAGGEALSDPALRARLEIARQAAPYLVLDLTEPRLRLMHGGAVLRDYPVAAIEAGASAVMFWQRSAALPPRGAVWQLRRLEPARSFGRPVVRPSAPGQVGASPPAIPLEPEKALPAPPRYLLRFDPGLSIEVVPETAERHSWRAALRSVRWRIRELAESISPHPEIRLRLVLPAPEAGALYRSLPLPVSLTVS